MSATSVIQSTGQIQAMTDKEGKYLTFALAHEEYGLEILKVREIIGYIDVTAIPQTPRDIKGVINLRGQVIPVVDLRAKFGMETTEVTEQTCIIVVEITQSGRKFNTGIIVDRVQEVLDIAGKDIEEAPQFGSRRRHRLHPRHGQGRRIGQDPARHRQGAGGRQVGRSGAVLSSTMPNARNSHGTPHVEMTTRSLKERDRSCSNV